MWGVIKLASKGVIPGQNNEVVILVEKQLSQYNVVTNNNDNEPAREHTQNWSFIKPEITFLLAARAFKSNF